jgi:hypothetical protein
VGVREVESGCGVVHDVRVGGHGELEPCGDAEPDVEAQLVGVE